MPPYTIARSSAPQKPPALSKDDAMRLWYSNRQLLQTNNAVVQSKERYKTSAAAATRRCSELESRLSEIERRATEAEERVAHLRQELERQEKQTASRATEAEKRVAQLRQALERREKHTASSVLRRKLLNLVKTFHPDRTTTTTPTEVTKALNALVEELGGCASY
jgi:predicted RNase H-like nuclease (RuvC/YqgF family)